ncbi:MAG: NAD-glutamate dehydrogenase [Pseudomonadota bacterium]
MSSLINALVSSMPNARDYTAQFFADAYPDDLAHLTQKKLEDVAAAHRGWGKSFKPGDLHLTFDQIPHDGGTAIDIVSDDMAFVVDSVAAALTDLGHEIELMVHPRMPAGYDSTVYLSHMHIVLGKKLAKPQQERIATELRRVMQDIVDANRDWAAMREQVGQCQDYIKNGPADPAKTEYSEFLNYLYDGNFTFLGYRFYDLTKQGAAQVVDKSGLGLLRDDRVPVFINNADISLPDKLQTLRRTLPQLTISKVNRNSTVHRRVPLDCVEIKQYSDTGDLIGQAMFIGLFTSVTYARSLRNIPYLRWKADQVMERSQYQPGTHDYKAMRHILERYPRDELFQIDVATLQRFATSILRQQERRRVSLYLRPDPFGRFVSALVYIPRDQFDTRMRTKFQRALEHALGGETSLFYSSVDDSMLARILYNISIPPFTTPHYDAIALEKMLQDLASSWEEKLEESLLVRHGDDEGTILHDRYVGAFPLQYQERNPADKTAHDIQALERVLATLQIGFYLYRPGQADPGELRLKVYNPSQPIALSSIMPILENMGLWVVAEEPFLITPPATTGDPVWIQDFWLTLPPELLERVDLKAFHKSVENALHAVWWGEAENDCLNQLVLAQQMSWRDVALLRSFVKYAVQIQSTYTIQALMRALTDHSDIAIALLRLFNARHNPALADKGREAAQSAEKDAIKALLQDVPSLDHDRILRIYLNLIMASLRTNYYQPNSDGIPKTYIATKYDSQAIAILPDPKPYREIFVYSPRVEGVHLRFDKIARGGLRWSDRPDDFRTEVLGLVKAQNVKNAVIVPMGAKGGFILKNAPDGKDRQAFQAEGIACYRIFIQALLDITDNRKGKDILPPRKVVCHDAPDPYLVVAADKGTATFSDIANSISIENDFWLGDAFASGGSAGYDHKKMGITARGGWEAVKRHFRELDIDTQSQDFNVIGVGDMGGDVFGNAMLLSPHIRLIGAFNHVHIFCDPNPDIAKSHAERARLFADVKGWDAYDLSLLSPGGMIFSRADKELVLTPEIKASFGLTVDRCPPSDLIQAMLRTPTDLLWFGGIGTYIKAKTESHMDVGDKTNNALRVNAEDIKAKVIGEGANLGITQKARIVMSRAGVRLNTDFVDNSAGVDCSDHEVNIKILLRDCMTAGALREEDRNALLSEMTEDVAAHVLQNNYQQTQAISLMTFRAGKRLPQHMRLMQHLTQTGLLDRAVETLPDDEACKYLQQHGQGLSRAELCVLQSYAKIQLTRDILASNVPDAEAVENILVTYFPPQLQSRFLKQIKAHQLRREIIATYLCNLIVNRVGGTFVYEMAALTGYDVPVIVQAVLLVSHIYDLHTLWQGIEMLDGKVPAVTQMQAYEKIADLLEQDVAWLLRRYGGNITAAHDVTRYATVLSNLHQIMRDNIPDVVRAKVEAEVQTLEGAGFPAEMAYRIVLLPFLAHGCDIIRLAETYKHDVAAVTQLYFAIDTTFYLSWLQNQTQMLTSGDTWGERVLDGLQEGFIAAQGDISALALADGVIAPEAIAEWMRLKRPQAGIVQTRLAELFGYTTLTLPMLLSAAQELRKLV